MKSVFIITLFFTFVVSDDVIVNIQNLGTVLGTTDYSAWTNKLFYKFLSIKYALSPSSERRFQPPEPITPWENTYNATVEGISCPQLAILESIQSETDKDWEDCLTLNIFTPMVPDDDVKQNQLFPVMFYIHGGAFVFGNSAQFPPHYFLEHDIVLVVIQYRLGPFGFLSTESDELPGNVGLLDQVLALKWVNQHIKSFGGDNSRVTIFGESAGAAAASLHLFSPMVDEYLFQKAILQSGSTFGDWVINPNPLKSAKILYSFLTENSIEFDKLEMEHAFKNATTVELLKSYSKMRNSGQIDFHDFGIPIIQKFGKQRYLTENPDLSLTSGNYRTVPMIAGVTKNEGSFITRFLYDYLKKINLQDNDSFLRNNLTSMILHYLSIYDVSNSVLDTINNKYFKNIFEHDVTYKDVTSGITDIAGMFVLKAPTLKHAKMNAKYTNETYFYTFDYRGEYTLAGFGKSDSQYPFDQGVHHGDDLIYIFPYYNKTALNDEDTKIAMLMTDLWVNFATNGIPESSLMKINWPKLQKDKNGPYIHINRTSYFDYDFVDNEYDVTTKEKTISTNYFTKVNSS